MSSTIDANILLYASDSSSPHHEPALAFLRERAAGPDILYLFWPVVMAYLRIATHPGIFQHPLDPNAATENVESLLALPHVRTEGETQRFWEVWRATTQDLAVRGNLVPDAHLVALMREHGVGTIWSRDRDLRRFDGIRVLDPFPRA
ncbi:MAG: PIN domain-containing protein [Acidobacteria bacterium]|nr:PIN domain-containing protein [Acidobacteriota bacterium]